jgi:uroporphyrinogen-III synthase
MQILITRDAGNVEPFGSYLRKYGFAPYSVPLIETSAIAVPGQMLRQILEVPFGAKLIWVFSSPQGVSFLAEALLGVSVPQPVQFVAQGEATAQAISRHFGERCSGSSSSTVSPVRTNREMGEWLVRNFPKDDVSFVIIGPKERSRGCEDVLRLANRVVGVLPVYETRGRRVNEGERKLVETFYSNGTVVFFSPSAVQSWMDNGFRSPYHIASFGPVTSEAVIRHGMEVAFEAGSNSLEEFAMTLRARSKESTS